MAEGMDVEELKKARDVKAQRRALIVEKWKTRVIKTPGKRRMDPHQLGAVKGKPRVEERGEEDAGHNKSGDGRRRS